MRHSWIAIALVLTGCGTSNPDQVTHEVYANRLMADKMAVAADAQRQYAALLAEGQSRVERKQEMLEHDVPYVYLNLRDYISEDRNER